MGRIDKIVKAGLGLALLTEEGVRSLFGGSMKFSKEARGYLLKHANQRKEVLTQIIAEEIRRFLEKMDLHKELRKALEGVTFEVKLKGRKGRG